MATRRWDRPVGLHMRAGILRRRCRLQLLPYGVCIHIQHDARRILYAENRQQCFLEDCLQNRGKGKAHKVNTRESTPCRPSPPCRPWKKTIMDPLVLSSKALC